MSRVDRLYTTNIPAVLERISKFLHDKYTDENVEIMIDSDYFRDVKRVILDADVDKLVIDKGYIMAYKKREDGVVKEVGVFKKGLVLSIYLVTHIEENE